jgi:hypothetical protein
MNGPFNSRVMEDEKMVEDIAKTSMSSRSIIHNSRIVIYDARPYLNAQANKLKKGGFEDSRFYRNSEINFCDIDNIHKVSEVFKKMQEMTLSPENFDSVVKFSEKVDTIGYYKLINRILRAANNVVETIL